MPSRRRSAAGLSLVEALVAAALLGLLAALAVPAAGSPREEGKLAQLVSGVSILRTAIDSYWSQHDDFPGQQDAGQFVEQLTRATNRAGRVGEGPGFGYGPYLRRGELPPNPYGGGNTLQVVAAMPSEPTGATAWIYDRSTGEVRPNVPGATPDGVELFDL